MYLIGIDTGVNTGLAVWNTETKDFALVQTVKIHTALDIVKKYSSENIVVFVEDARLRKGYYGDNAEAKKQQVGYVKRDAVTWEDFLSDHKIPFKMIHPIAGATKLDSGHFRRLTGWKGRTSNHSRDAAMIVFKKRFQKF